LFFAKQVGSDFWEKMDIAYPQLNDANLLLPFDDLPRLGKPK
jgi:hypothetical protein